MEPRARQRKQNALNFGSDLEGLLGAFGNPFHPTEAHHEAPYAATVRVLDEILTDFVIETCHSAVSIATYAGRAKLKLDDVLWALRKDERKVGKIRDMLAKGRDIAAARKAVNVAEGTKMGVDELGLLAEGAGEEGTGKGKGRGRGKRKKKDQDVDLDAEKSVNNGDDLDMDGDEGDEDASGNEKKKAKRQKKSKSDAGSKV